MEHGVHVGIPVFPVEVEPFVRIAHIDHVREALKCPARTETGQSTEQTIEREKPLESNQDVSDVFRRFCLRGVVEDF